MIGWVGCLVGCSWLAGNAAAQPPPPAPIPAIPAIAPGEEGLGWLSMTGGAPVGVEEGSAKFLPPEIAPRPAKSPREIASFIDSLGTNDAAFKVEIGQGRILTTKEDVTAGQNQPLIAVGDPSVVDFAIVSPRQIRVTGLRVGVTDLSITTADGRQFSFEIRVVADLGLISGKLKAMFPDASIRLGQLRDHIVVEGEARDSVQITRIMETIAAYLNSVQVGQLRRVQGQQARALGNQPNAAPALLMPPGGVAPEAPSIVTPDLGGALQIQGTVATPQIINLMRVPGSQQVLLKVRVAELNRTALRQIGANFLGVDPRTGTIVGTQIAGAAGVSSLIAPYGQASPLGGFRARSLSGSVAEGLNGAQSTVFGIFQDANFEFILNALRQNSMLKILAEPNLVAMSGYQASFLAGGEFPVPVPQVSASGVAPTITVRFREFGVRLNFVPFILDGETVRLSVAPEVSQIDFSIATTLVAGGTPVPGLNTRKAATTVELHQGQTLAIAGLLQLTLNGQTTRIPGLGDLPVLGPFFSNTTGQRTEKELVVLVTPYLVEPMNPGQVPPGPGDEVKEPKDLEFYFLNRIEGRTGVDARSTTIWDDPYHLVPLLKLEQKYVHGPSGFSD